MTAAPFYGTNWYSCTNTCTVPRGAILAGIGPSGEVYVGGIQHLREFTPTKIVTRQQTAYYPADGKEHNTKHLMYLCTEPGFRYKWKDFAVVDQLPNGACRIGHRNDGQPYYVTRVIMNGHPVVAKFCPHSRTCRAPMNGSVHSHNMCQILIIKREY